MNRNSRLTSSSESILYLRFCLLKMSKTFLAFDVFHKLKKTVLSETITVADKISAAMKNLRQGQVFRPLRKTHVIGFAALFACVARIFVGFGSKELPRKT